MKKVVFATKLSFFDKELVKIEELANYLRVSPLTLQKWRCNSNGPKFLKIGSKVIYRGNDIKEWIEKCTRENTFSKSKPVIFNTQNKEAENARRKSAV